METERLILFLLGGLLPLSVMAYFLGRHKAVRLKRAGNHLHSRLDYYGWYTLVWLSLPPMLVAILAAFLQMAGVAIVPPTMLLTAALATAGGGLWLALRRIKPATRARNAVERVIEWTLIAASLVSILTTLGIVVSILFESIRFFNMVSLWDFLTGTDWSPEYAFLGGAGRGTEQMAEPKFGSVPIFAGTFMITTIAMCVAMPVGLLSAIYMAEYASHSMREASKPILEILAGIPTVVYGFFAAITVAPLVVKAAEYFGLRAEYINALSPGVVMGIMIIPLVSSLSDDVITSVPQSMREGSYALGMTRSETIRHVLVPAALPGIVSAFLLAVSHALGETMIVVMAAGLQPHLTWNPLEPVTTVTVRIVDALTGDQAFDSPETLSAFGLGLVLFVVTLTLNIAANIIIHKFRKRFV